MVDSLLQRLVGRDFPHPSILALGSHYLPLQRVPVRTRGLSGEYVALTTHSRQSLRLSMCKAITLLPLCEYNGVLGRDLYL